MTTIKWGSQRCEAYVVARGKLEVLMRIIPRLETCAEQGMETEAVLQEDFFEEHEEEVEVDEDDEENDPTVQFLVS